MKFHWGKSPYKIKFALVWKSYFPYYDIHRLTSEISVPLYQTCSHTGGNTETLVGYFFPQTDERDVQFD